MFNNLQSLIGNQAWDDLCEKFAEQAVYGHANMYPNAITAWTSQSKNGVSGLNGIQPGDLVYFSPNEGNGYNGHTGIYQGNNQFLSATDNGVQLNDIGKWVQSTGQQVLGYIPTSNPQLKQQLSTLKGGSANQQSELASANPTGDAESQLQQEQDYQNRVQQAQQAASWFQQYQQQQQQNNAMSMPRQATNYAPLSVSAQPTQAENWLKQYTG